MIAPFFHITLFILIYSFTFSIIFLALVNAESSVGRSRLLLLICDFAGERPSQNFFSLDHFGSVQYFSLYVSICRSVVFTLRPNHAIATLCQSALRAAENGDPPLDGGKLTEGLGLPSFVPRETTNAPGAQRTGHS